MQFKITKKNFHKSTRTSIQPYVTDNSINVNVFLGFQNNMGGVVGIAWVGVVCFPTIGYRSGVVEYFQNDLSTGQVKWLL